MIKTTKEWQSTSMLNKIIERGILCIEITTNDAFFAKVGDGRRSYKNLPYLFQSSFDQLTNVDTSLMKLIQNGLGERYTKEEIDAIEHELRDLIQNIDLSNYVTNEVLHEYTQSFTPEEKEKLASLENADLSGLDARVAALEEIDHSLYATGEYVDEKIENLDITVDLSDYATITYVDEKIAAIDIPSIDLSMYATKSWVSTQIANIPGMDLTGYATERYVDDAIAAIPPFIETEYLNGTDIEIVDNGDGTKTVNYVGEDDDTTYDFHGKNGINVTELSNYTSYLNFDDSSYDWNPDSGELTVKNRDARSWTVITPSKELPPGIYELTRTNTTGTLQILHYPFDPSYDYNSDDDEEKPESEKKTKHISEGESTLTFTLSEDTRILIKSNYSTANVFPLTNYLHLEKISSDLKEYEIGLLPATHSTLGGVIIGEGINLDQDGVISVDTSDLSDTKVTQSAATGNNYRPLIMGSKYSTTAGASTLQDTVTDQVYTNASIYANPNTGTICANRFKGESDYVRHCYAKNDTALTGKWVKIATCTSTLTNDDKLLVLLVSNGYSSAYQGHGILRCRFRTGSTKGTLHTASLSWDYITNGLQTPVGTSAPDKAWATTHDIDPSNFVATYTATSGTSLVYDLWVKVAANYQSWTFTVLNDTSRVGNVWGPFWTLSDYANTGGQDALPSSTGQVVSKVATLYGINDNPEWVTLTNGSGLNSVSVLKCKKQGNIVYIRGMFGVSSTTGTITPMAVLPDGYYATDELRHISYSPLIIGGSPSAGTGDLQINTTGTMNLYTNNSSTFTGSATAAAYIMDVSFMI